MEKHRRVSTVSKPSSIEAMRESASTIDGILTGVLGALSGRDDIAEEILQLLMIGAARAEILVDDLGALKRPTLVRGH
jgi:hypothetical protein